MNIIQFVHNRTGRLAWPAAALSKKVNGLDVAGDLDE